MDAVWNSISNAEQARILQALDLDQLPAPAALDESQRKILAGVVGDEAAAKVLTAAQATLSTPQLAPPAIGGDWSDIMAMVAEIRQKIDESQLKVSSEELKAQKATTARANADRLQKLKENVEKIHDAKNASLWSKIFGWIGTVLSVIAAVAALVVMGPAAIPMIVMTALALTMQILQETGQWDKIMDALVDFMIDNGLDSFNPIGLFLPMCGLGFLPESDEPMSREELKMWMQLFITAALICGSIGASGPLAAAKVGDAAKSTYLFSKLESYPKIAAALKYVGLGSQGGNAVAGVGGGVSGAVQAEYAKEAAQAQADAKEMQAWLARLNQMMSEESERLQQLIERLNQGVSDLSEMISEMAKSQFRTASRM